MTVIPFAPRAARRRRREEPPAAAVTAVFAAPAGGRGRFTGWYRLESCVPERGGLAAVGVFTGTLDDAQGQVIAVAARRTRAAATVLREGREAWIVLEPVEVDLAGFVLAFPAVVVGLHGTAWTAGEPGAGPRAAAASDGAGR